VLASFAVHILGVDDEGFYQALGAAAIVLLTVSLICAIIKLCVLLKCTGCEQFHPDSEGQYTVSAYGVAANHGTVEVLGIGRPVVGQPIQVGLTRPQVGAPVVKGEPTLAAHSTTVAVHEEGIMSSDPKLAARKDRESIPVGMALVELKDRTCGDSADEFVLELYKCLQNGAKRANGVQSCPSSDGRVVLVPESDLAELQQAWQTRMQQGRRNVEAAFHEQGQMRRAPRLSFFVRNDDGSALKADLTSFISDDSRSTAASSQSVGI
jgi:hypothetical protein